MKRTTMLILSAVMMAGVAMAQEPAGLQKALPDGRIAVAREGGMGTDGTGRYSLRIYGAPEKPGQAPTNYLGGLERPREGRIEKMELIDLNGDDQPEIVVVMRAPDSGMFAAEAFHCDDQRLDMVASVKGLHQDTADVIGALRARLSGKPVSEAPAAASGEAGGASAGVAAADDNGQNDAAADDAGFTADGAENAAPAGSAWAENPSGKVETEPASADRESDASGNDDAAGHPEEQESKPFSGEKAQEGNGPANGAGETGSTGEPGKTEK